MLRLDYANVWGIKVALKVESADVSEWWKGGKEEKKVDFVEKPALRNTGVCVCVSSSRSYVGAKVS